MVVKIEIGKLEGNRENLEIIAAKQKRALEELSYITNSLRFLSGMDDIIRRLGIAGENMDRQYRGTVKLSHSLEKIRQYYIVNENNIIDNGEGVYFRYKRRSNRIIDTRERTKNISKVNIFY